MRKYHSKHSEIPYKTEVDSMKAFKYKLLAFGLLLTIAGCQSSASEGNLSLNSPRSGEAALLNPSPDQSIQTTSISGPITPVSSNPYIGNAAHICGPSGFGRRSHCFLRN
jgi:hypothetical protein